MQEKPSEPILHQMTCLYMYHKTWTDEYILCLDGYHNKQKMRCCHSVQMMQLLNWCRYFFPEQEKKKKFSAMESLFFIESSHNF